MVTLGIADDEPDILGLFHIMLGKSGIRIAYMARNGREAIEMQRKTPADVVILDYCMPPTWTVLRLPGRSWESSRTRGFF